MFFHKYYLDFDMLTEHKYIYFLFYVFITIEQPKLIRNIRV